MDGGDSDNPGSHRHLHFDLDATVGGPARRRVILLLAGLLGLQAADTGAVGALAAPLEHSLHIDNTQIGLLVAVATLVGVVATLPFGALTDRVDRSRMLQILVALWAVATLVGAVSVNFTMLLVSRLFLGGVIAAAGPAVASLVGDLFPPDERGRLYSYVFTGELIGAGFGILLAGALSSVTSWRVAIGVLAIPAVYLAWAYHHYLPEPARGGQSHLAVGDTEIVAAADVEGDDGAPVAPTHEDPSLVAQQAEDLGARPEPGTVVIDTDLGWWEAVRYILRVRTNDALILASGLGWFFLGGLETFAELYFRERYGVGQSLASILFVLVAGGALVGVIVSGRAADRRIEQGHPAARLAIGGAAYIATAVVFVPAALIPSLVVAVPIYVVAAAAIGASNPPTDAARLDVMPSHLWGRAEAVRTALRQALQGIAPVIFGLVSGVFGPGGSVLGAGINTKSATGSAAAGHGLEMAFVILSAPLVLAGITLLVSRRRYLSDAVAAMHSARRREEVMASSGSSSR